MLTVKEIYDKYFDNNEIEILIDSKLTFGVDADEDGNFETDNKEDVVEFVSEMLCNLIGDENYTGEYMVVIDTAAEMIVEYHYSDVRDAWRENAEFNDNPSKYYGVCNRDFL